MVQLFPSPFLFGGFIEKLTFYVNFTPPEVSASCSSISSKRGRNDRIGIISVHSMLPPVGGRVLFTVFWGLIIQAGGLERLAECKRGPPSAL